MHKLFLVWSLVLVACGGGGKNDGGTGPGVDGGQRPSDGGSACVPTTCAAAQKNCGALSDGCGSTLACGTCADTETCGGGGPNVCGTGVCVPVTCDQLGATCGAASDGCGNALSCGTCGAGAVCGYQAGVGSCVGNCSHGCPSGYSCDLHGVCEPPAELPDAGVAFTFGMSTLAGNVTKNGASLGACGSLHAYLNFVYVDGGFANERTLACDGGTYSYSVPLVNDTYDVLFSDDETPPLVGNVGRVALSASTHADFDLQTHGVSAKILKNGAELGHACGASPPLVKVHAHGGTTTSLTVACNTGQWRATGDLGKGSYYVTFDDTPSADADLPHTLFIAVRSWDGVAPLTLDLPVVSATLKITGSTHDTDSATFSQDDQLYYQGVNIVVNHAGLLFAGTYSVFTEYPDTGYQYADPIVVPNQSPQTITLAGGSGPVSGAFKLDGGTPPAYQSDPTTSVNLVFKSGPDNTFSVPLAATGNWTFSTTLPAATYTVTLDDYSHLVPLYNWQRTLVVPPGGTTMNVNLTATQVSGRLSSNGTQITDCAPPSEAIFTSTTGTRYFGHMRCDSSKTKPWYYVALVPPGTYDVRLFGHNGDDGEWVSATKVAVKGVTQALDVGITNFAGASLTAKAVTFSDICSSAFVLSDLSCPSCALFPTRAAFNSGNCSGGSTHAASATFSAPKGPYQVSFLKTFYQAPSLKSPTLTNLTVGGAAPAPIDTKLRLVRGTLAPQGTPWNCTNNQPSLVFKDLESGVSMTAYATCGKAVTDPLSFEAPVFPGNYQVTFKFNGVGSWVLYDALQVP